MDPDAANEPVDTVIRGSRRQRRLQFVEEAGQPIVGGEHPTQSGGLLLQQEARRLLVERVEERPKRLPIGHLDFEGRLVVQAVHLGVEKVQHRQELPLIVQHGRRRQQQQPRDLPGQLLQRSVPPRKDGVGMPGQRGDVVRLIHDQDPGVQVLDPGCRGVVGQDLDSMCAEVADQELLLEFGLPLWAEERRDDDQGLAAARVQQVLPDDQPRLDRLAEAHLVRQQVALNRILEDAPDDLDLVVVMPDHRGSEAGDASGGRALLDHRPNEGTATLCEIWRLKAASDRNLGRIHDRLSPAHMDHSARKPKVLGVRCPHDDVVIVSVHDPADTPLAVAHPVAAALAVEPEGLQIADRRLKSVSSTVGDRVEVLNEHRSAGGLADCLPRPQRVGLRRYQVTAG